MTNLNKVIYKVALKLSGKTKEQFDFIFNLAWFFNRSTWKSLRIAVTDKGSNVKVRGCALLRSPA
jgi:hypothetical protein